MGNQEVRRDLWDFLENNNPRTFGVTGSRGFTDDNIVNYVLALCHGDSRRLTMHNGMARGADTLCYNYWSERQLDVVAHPPNLKMFGSPKAYHVRNLEIVTESDFMLAFLNGPTSGTMSTIEVSQRKSVPLFVFSQEE